MCDHYPKYKTYKAKYMNVKNSLKMLTPATFFNLFEKENIAIVNTLENPNFVVKKPFDKKFLKLYYSSDDFKKIDPTKFDLIIFYCANYSCSAAKNYAKEIIDTYNSIKEKSILYEGGLYEWSNLSLNYQEFGIYNVKTNKMCTDDELYEINKSYAHFLESKKKNLTFPTAVYKNIGADDFYKNLTQKETEIVKSSSGLLEGKVCVVTGATSGLGLETLKRMLDQGAKHVTGTFQNNIERATKVSKMLEEKYGEERFMIIQADARTEAGNKKTFDPIERAKYLNKDLIAINCLDVNAGIFGPANLHKKHVFNINDEDYDKVMDLNLRGYYLAVKHFSKQAIQNNVKDGSIVCIKSIYGSTGSLFSNIAYQISKHGTMGLVRQSAVEMARPNEKLGLKFPIRVNAVSPTFTDTALTRPFLNYKQINDTISNSNTTGELAKKEDVANAVIFLCSKLSGSITGVDLPVDCGVLAESVPTYPEVKALNDDKNIEELSCCGDTL